MSDEETIILIMRTTNKFGIVIAELKRVTSLSQFMMVEGMVRSNRVDMGRKDLRRLAKLCEELQHGSLYANYANKKMYRHEEDFWATTEAVVKSHVKRMADLRLVEAIGLAEALNIPLLYVADEKSPLHISERLHVEDKLEVTPVMNFQRHDDGTTYRLQLRIGSRLVENVAEHHLIVLAYDPGVFILDGCIFFLNEGFSGKLLLPFVSKSVVEIPHRIENDYFHRFILKHVTRAEIHAEGFEITDISIQPCPCLTVEKTFNGKHLLSLSFKYGNMEYAPFSKSNGRVTMTEEGGSFQFIRQLRNRQQEQLQVERLQQLTGCSAQGDIWFTSLRAMIDWLRENAPKLRVQGFEVVQPSNRVYYIGPLSVEQSDTWHGDWLQTDVTVVIDDGRLRFPFLDLRDTILSGEQEYMLPSGELLLIPFEWLQRYTDLLLTGMPKDQGFRRHRSQVNSLTNSTSPNGEKAIHSLNDKNVSTLLMPRAPWRGAKGEMVKLRPYQQTGFLWLWQNLVAQTGCCLSDEMGLGKTLQTIALLLTYKEVAKVVRKSQPVPGMLFSEEEMRGIDAGQSAAAHSDTHIEFKTSLVVAPASVVHNWRNEMSRFAPSLLVMNYTGDMTKRLQKRHAFMQWDVVLTSYRTLQNDIDYFDQQQFGIVVFDECQAFKTHTSLIHHAVRRLNAYHRMALSGTPVENNLVELWSLMNVLNPNLLGDIQSFKKAFIYPIAIQMEEGRRELLRQLIAPYFLKRTKEEVLSDLPERQDEIVVCPMTVEQTSSYAEELSKARNEWLDTNVKSQNRQINMLAALQRLRQIANGEGKLSVVFEYLGNLRHTHHKVLIFSEYVSILEHVGSEMTRRGWSYDLLTGQTHNREQVIAHFQQSADSQFFLISLKAGGVGLNLTAADYVFMLDPWWNRSAEEQAIARAHRIGQHRAVFVYRFVSANTLEEQILTLQDRKQSLIDSVMPFILR